MFFNMNRLSRKIWYIYTQFFLSHLFMRIGKGSIIIKPMQIDYAKSVKIDENVSIYQFVWIMGNKVSNKETLKIEAGTTIGHFAHIIARHSVTIEKDVLIADRVFISDCSHGYEDINTPIALQDIRDLNPVVIGEGSWIGENVCICGASIGKHCVIGANSVVMLDIPDYCIAVGCPAKVIKRYDFCKKVWVKL